jgi:hypothetical protein
MSDLLAADKVNFSKVNREASTKPSLYVGFLFYFVKGAPKYIEVKTFKFSITKEHQFQRYFNFQSQNKAKRVMK